MPSPWSSTRPEPEEPTPETVTAEAQALARQIAGVLPGWNRLVIGTALTMLKAINNLGVPIERDTLSFWIERCTARAAPPLKQPWWRRWWPR